MAFWRKDDRSREVTDPRALVARREYEKALRIYRAQLAARPDDYNLNHRIADVLCLAGRTRESLEDYVAAADGYAREGFLIKAIAILKKLQRLDPTSADVERRLIELSRAGSSAARGAPPAGTAPAAAAAGDPGGGPELAFDMEEIQDERPPIPVAPPDDTPAAAPGLTNTPLFSDFTPDELRGLIARLRQATFAAGQAIVTEGAPGDSLFVLGTGRVRVTTTGPKGAPIVLAELVGGDFFGEVSLLTGRPRTATITALEETETLELLRGDLEALESGHPRVRQVVREFYERRVASTIEAMIHASRSKKPPVGG